MKIRAGRNRVANDQNRSWEKKQILNRGNHGRSANLDAPSDRDSSPKPFDDHRTNFQKRRALIGRERPESTVKSEVCVYTLRSNLVC